MGDPGPIVLERGDFYELLAKVAALEHGRLAAREHAAKLAVAFIQQEIAEAERAATAALHQYAAKYHFDPRARYTFDQAAYTLRPAAEPA